VVCGTKGAVLYMATAAQFTIINRTRNGLSRYSYGLLVLNTGTGKPAVFPKRVARVRVRWWSSAHCDTPCTRTAVSRVWMGKFQRGDPNFSLIFPFFTSVFSSKFRMSHRDRTKYGSISRMHLSSYHQLSPLSHSHPTSKKKVSHSLMLQN